jgi:hypothetical protein
MSKKLREVEDELRDVKGMLALERRLRVRSELRLGYANERVRNLSATIIELSVERAMKVVERREREERETENTVAR